MGTLPSTYMKALKILLNILYRKSLYVLQSQKTIAKYHKTRPNTKLYTTHGRLKLSVDNNTSVFYLDNMYSTKVLEGNEWEIVAILDHRSAANR